MATGRHFSVAAGRLVAIWLGVLMLAVDHSAATVASSDQLSVPPELRCPDGRIPLNSPQSRCRSQPQLQWTGRQCQNSSLDFSCPSGFDCLAGGICCESPEAPPYLDLCRMSWAGSKAVDTAGSCSRDEDCKSYDSLASKCCGGSCILLKQRCFRQRRQFLSILSTGQVPRLYMPNCTDDGAFEPVQWEPRFNQRWCVDQRTGLALRSGCCLAGNSGSTCSNPRPCPPELCALSVCPARLDAACRVSVCDTGECRAEFFDAASGRPVDCGAGLSRCQAGEAAYFDGLAYLRARDQTQWLQTNAINKPATLDRNLAAFMDTCQQDECQAYSASMLEPVATSYGYYYKQDCPKQDRLNYRCRNRCNSYAGCPSQQVCCNSGCGLECMSPADIKPESQCAMSISSGHCPAVGCYKMCRRWGYDSARKVCRPFWYAGSGGNNNRYNSLAECEWMVQNCHGRVRIALPVRPLCQRRSGDFNNVQMSDNAMYWCVNKDGVPTPGTLHADSIACTSDGQLVENKYYKKVAYMYKARCPNGALPAWCHNQTVDRTCGSPGVITFADACDNCRLVHINANGQEVSCQTDSTACAASTISPSAAASPSVVACQPAPTTPSFRYSTGTGQCSAKCPVSGTSGYAREAGCLSVCARGWCGKNATAFYPDLCVSPACKSWPGALCVPDECSGSERYFLPNGTELTNCARRLAALLPTDVADCSSTATSTTTPAGGAARTSTTTPAGGAAIASTTTPAGGGARTSATTPAGGGARTSATTPAGGVAIASTSTPRGGAVGTSTTTKAGETAAGTTTTLSGGAAVASTTTPHEGAAAATSTSTVPPLTTSTTSTKAPTTKPPPKTILPICQIRFHLGVESMKCRATDGRYEPRQCNLTHCFCVVVDSGTALSEPNPMPLAKGASLACPVVETTNLSVTITYDSDYMSVLPTMQDEEKLQGIVASRFAYEGGLLARHIRAVDLEPGSILVTVGMQKPPGDTAADLPASAFELKTMALKQTLTIDFNGVTLTPSARQSFNENSGSSVVEPPVEKALTGDGGDSGSSSSGGTQLNVIGIVAGVLITVAVVAVAGVLIAFALRRRAQSGSSALPHESGNYETMSNASQSTGGTAYDNFANKVYGPVEDVYDNIAQPASTA